MSEVSQEIDRQLVSALKSKDQETVSNLRMLKSALANEKIAKLKELSPEEEAAVVRREVKKRLDTAKIYRDAGQTEKGATEEREAAFLKQFLPPELSEEEVRNKVREILGQQEGKINFGKVMGRTMQELAGQASGERVETILREEMGKIS